MKSSNGYAIDYIENTITVTKKFLKEAGVIGSPAYKELAQVRKDLPHFQIVQREIAKKQGKKTYGKLTYEVMREFIEVKEEEYASDVLKEFEQIQKLSKIRSGSYAFVKSWFLTRYKEEFAQETELEADQEIA